MIRPLGDKKPEIADSAFVSEAAYVVGDVEIGENSSVWPGAVIRGDLGKIKIGKNVAIEDNCVIHSGSPATPPTLDVTIGDNVQIGHGAAPDPEVIDQPPEAPLLGTVAEAHGHGHRRRA